MGKFSDLILVSDFDQTMTDYSSHIPQSNLDLIRYFMEEGGVFTLATGRSLPMSRYRFLDVPVNAPLIVCNGAVCYDPATEEILFCHPLPEDCMELMQHYERTFPHLRLEIHCLDKHYIFHHDKDRDAYLEQQKAAYAYVPWEEVPHPQVKFCMYSPRSDIFSITADSEEGKFFAWLEQDANERGNGSIIALNSLPGLVEVQVANTSKGLAARELAQRLGRKTLVCAGDAINDLSMLEEADIAFVPTDCDERVRGLGFREAAACTEGTIADVIRQLEEIL